MSKHRTIVGLPKRAAPPEPSAEDPDEQARLELALERTEPKPRRRRITGVMQAEPGPSSAPKLLSGRYRLLYPIGSGAMSMVYLAEHVQIGKRVAIKIMTTGGATAAKAAERFLREARGTSRIRHPNVVEISDFGEAPDGAPFFVMEYLDGEDLGATLMREGPLPWPRAAKLVAQIAKGLAAAHEVGVIHRDLKPENCIRWTREGDPDFVTIIDFGVAKVRDQARLTETGFMVGTPHYMSPEQSYGESMDHRTDIYALGVILFELLTGELPFDGELMQVLASHRYDPVPALAEVAPEREFPDGAEAVIRKALQKQPEHRFASMAEFLAAIEALSEGGEGIDLHVEDDAGVRPDTSGPMTFARTDDRPAPASGEVPGEAPVTRPPTQRGSRPWVFAGVGVASVFLSFAVFVVTAQRGAGPVAPERVRLELEMPIVDRPWAIRPFAEPVVGPVRVDIRTNVDARVVDARDGAIYGHTNIEGGFWLARGDERVDLRVEAEGYVPEAITLVPDRDHRIERGLEKDRGSGTEASPAGHAPSVPSPDPDPGPATPDVDALEHPELKNPFANQP